jgi:thioredoxin reductase (NADPH)
MQKELQKFVDQGKITVHLATTTDEIIGDAEGKVVQVKGTDTESGNEVKIDTDGVFVFVGLKPNSEFMGGQLETDEIGLIKTDENLMSSMKGVFVAGDIRSGATMQVASAVGEGATAALKIREYLEGHVNIQLEV